MSKPKFGCRQALLVEDKPHGDVVPAAPIFRQMVEEKETSDLFSTAELRFEKAPTETADLVKEDAALYEVRPAKKKLE